MDEQTSVEEDEEENKHLKALKACSSYEDSAIKEAFSSIKSAILTNRTDIVRQILSAAESMRVDDYDSEEDGFLGKKEIRDKYDSDEYIDMLSLLLSHQDNDSGTLLHHATRVDFADICRTLLAAGANCIITNHEGKNPYMYCSSDRVRNVYVGEVMQAISQSRLYRVEQLLFAGIDANSRDGGSCSNSLLHWGATFGSLAIVSFLIEKRAEINAYNAHGATPLHDAVNRGDEDIIEELLKNGANVDIRAVDGPYKDKSPKDLASGNERVKELIDFYSTPNESNTNCDISLPDEDMGNDETESSISCNFDDNIIGKKSSSSSTHSTSKSSLAYPVSIPVDPVAQYLCPSPQHIKQFKGLYFVPPKELTIFLKGCQDNLLPMSDVIELFIVKFNKIGIQATCEFLVDNFNPSAKLPHIQCILNRDCFSHSEEYKIQINTHKVLIVSSCLPSLFYALSTFLQCLKLFMGKGVPLLQILDWPKYSHRSVIFDLCKNDIPTIDIFLEAIDILASLKINQVLFNINHFVDSNEDVAYTRSESLRLQVYCAKRFLSVVPYILIDSGSSLLKYTRNNSVPELCTDALFKRLQLFPLVKKLYVELVLEENQKIIQQLHSYCVKNGYLLQITSKEINFRYDFMVNIFDGVICTISATSNNQYTDQVTFLNDLGLPYIVCYNCVEANRIYPDIKELTSNVYNVFFQSSSSNCHGFSIKIAHELKQLHTFMTCLPSLIMASSMLWNLHEIMKNDVYIVNVINYLIYEDNKDIIGEMLVELGKSLPLYSPGVSCRSVFDDFVQHSYVDIQSLSPSSLQKVCKAVKVMRQKILLTNIKSSLKEPLVEETLIIANIVFFIARLSYKLLNLHEKTGDEIIEYLPQVAKSDEANRLMGLIREYETYCSNYCKTLSDKDFISVRLLKDILKKLLPECNLHTNSRSPSSEDS